MMTPCEAAEALKAKILQGYRDAISEQLPNGPPHQIGFALKLNPMLKAAFTARDRALLAEKYSDGRLDAVMSALLDEIEGGNAWKAMSRPQRLAYLSFKAALGCEGHETEAFIRGREAEEKLAAMTLLAEDEATVEAMAKAIYGWQEDYTTDFWRNYVPQVKSALAALRRLKGVE
jgi:hypothetical protein